MVNFTFPFVLRLSKHERLSLFDKLRANGWFSICMTQQEFLMCSQK